MNTKSLFRFGFIAILFATIVTSCKKQYDAPPEAYSPLYNATKTISQLKAMHTVTGAYDIINTDDTIVGTVIANDKSGNFYKQIVIRDASGAILVNLGGTLYTNFPVGRKVFIFCKGLALSDYHNMIQLGIKAVSNGNPTLQEIPTPLIQNYVVGGSLNNDASPISITQADLAAPTGVNIMQHPLLGNLVKLSGYEFVIGDTKRSYGDTSYWKYALNGQTHIKSCSGTSTIIVQTSGYADFAAKAPQAGNGDITSIFTVYGTTPQLVIRDTTDVQFSGARCFLYEEDFNAFPVATTCFNDPSWQNIQETGDVCYTIATFSGNVFAKVSAFKSLVLPSTNIRSWLIRSNSIAIPAGLSPKLSFTCATRYTVGTLTALVSTNYNGSTPATATWTPLGTVTTNSSSFTPFNSYGPYDLSAFAGQNVYIAFRYDVPAGTSTSAVGTFEIDDIKIAKN